ncbi:MAG: hypothetical protein UX10_C0005G0004 [Candidatus Magasanikbacteria bacterium GW2011_GWA2_45_39]|uniref:Uncharacterized protein n=1 Tax=Candidatus Magasanikbacteria bacterium GW2011_GWA2_45_39 TaxID=1619041 RepID=A0A0G1PQR6_9BACT|nr:MAG: hypothetical protein UX10_C0005G0004 [Candidatus Magasanikbacteria bacterium GW2011_GWA2_45_39]HBW74092.1 hypothetical protein [Candidatus Magasanikbacteria bacterium]
MADAEQSNDFLKESAQAHALNAARERARIVGNTHMRGSKNLSSKKNAKPQRNHPPTPNPNYDTDTSEENTNENNRQTQIYLLKRRGIELKKAADKDKTAAESMTISNQWIDLIASGIIEIGKATLKILIGFLILPAGFIMKTVKFFFDRQVSALKESSQKKNAQGEKLLAQAAKLEGKKNPFKRATQAVAEPIKNYIAELLSEFFPLGFSPLALFESAQEKQKAIYKILLRAAFFFMALAVSLLILAVVFLLLLEIQCNLLLLCKIATDVFQLKALEIMLKAVQ